MDIVSFPHCGHSKPSLQRAPILALYTPEVPLVSKLFATLYDSTSAFEVYPSLGVS